MPGDFDFSLSDAEETRARQLHDDGYVIDMVSMGLAGPGIFDEYETATIASRVPEDGPLVTQLFQGMVLPYQLEIEGVSDAIHRWWDESRITCASIAMSGIRPDDLEMIDRIWDPIFAGLPWLRPALIADDIRKAKSDGNHALFKNMQPAQGLSPDITDVANAYANGVRSLMLTYNRMDVAGIGCTERYDGGLSNYGIDVVAACNDLGMIVDTSHCGQMTTIDACKFSTAPVTANHTTASSIFEHDRGKIDDALQAVADTGGVIGIVTVPFFVSGDSAPTIEATLDHIDYVADKVGHEHVGIGTDWPFMCPTDVLERTLGALLAEIGFREEHGAQNLTAMLIGYEGGLDMVNITRGLVKRGHSDAAIQGILGGNFLRVFEQVCG